MSDLDSDLDSPRPSQKSSIDSAPTTISTSNTAENSGSVKDSTTFVRKQSSRKFDLNNDLDVRLRDKVKYMSGGLVSSRSKLKKESSRNIVETASAYDSQINSDAVSRDLSLSRNSSSDAVFLAPRSDHYTLYLEDQLNKRTVELNSLRQILNEQNKQLEVCQDERQREAVVLREAAELLSATEKVIFCIILINEEIKSFVSEIGTNAT